MSFRPHLFHPLCPCQVQAFCIASPDHHMMPNWLPFIQSCPAESAYPSYCAQSQSVKVKICSFIGFKIMTSPHHALWTQPCRMAPSFSSLTHWPWVTVLQLYWPYFNSPIEYGCFMPGVFICVIPFPGKVFPSLLYLLCSYSSL